MEHETAGDPVSGCKWYDIPFFLSAAFILFHPGGLAAVLAIDQEMKYALFPLGIIMYGMVVFLQKIRMRGSKQTE